jgi:hypothetical protein
MNFGDGPLKQAETLEEHAQNGARRETVPDFLLVRAAPFALLKVNN